jgi:methylaspartate ammonia-lyase
MKKRETVLRIKVRDAGEMIEYETIARRSGDEEVLKISGSTCCETKISGSTCCETKSCVAQILRRALGGKRGPPEHVEKAVMHVVGHCSHR